MLVLKELVVAIIQHQLDTQFTHLLAMEHLLQILILELLIQFTLSIKKYCGY